MGGTAGGGIVVIVDTPTKEDLKELLKMAKDQKEVRKMIEKSGFKIEEFIKDSKKKTCFCQKCKTINKIKAAYKTTHKNGIRFLRGKCTVCHADCWKTIEKD